jgi:hypothetical protein
MVIRSISLGFVLIVSLCVVLQAIADFESALEIEPKNANLQDMLRTALKKYEDTEGVPYSKSSRAPASTAQQTSADPHPSAAAAVFRTHNIPTAGSWSGLKLPADYEVVASGVLEEVQKGGGFTRIAIVDESDEESERAPSPSGGNDSSSGFTRIAIQDGSEEEEAGAAETAGADGARQPQAAAPAETRPGFTRIEIAEGSSSDDEEEEEPPAKAGAADPVSSFAELEALKSEGNALMSSGNTQQAVDVYSKCLQRLEGSREKGAVSTAEYSSLRGAVLNNRGLAFNSLEVRRHLFARVSCP